MQVFGLVFVEFLIPVFWFLINLLARSVMKLKQSSGADAILVMLAFDVSVLVDQDLFRRFVRFEDFAQEIGPAHGAFLLVGLICWLLALKLNEPEVERSYDGFHDASSRARFGIYFAISWILVSALFAFHISFYLHLPGQSNG